MCMGNLTHRGNIGQRHDGVGRRLNVDEFGRRLDGRFDSLQIARVHVFNLDAVVADDEVEQPLRAAIDVARNDDVIARAPASLPGHRWPPCHWRMRAPAVAAFER